MIPDSKVRDSCASRLIPSFAQSCAFGKLVCCHQTPASESDPVTANINLIFSGHSIAKHPILLFRFPFARYVASKRRDATRAIFDEMSVNTTEQPSTIIPDFYPRGKPRNLGQLEIFLLSAIAPAIAVIFTNPFDTASTNFTNPRVTFNI